MTKKELTPEQLAAKAAKKAATLPEVPAAPVTLDAGAQLAGASPTRTLAQKNAEEARLLAQKAADEAELAANPSDKELAAVESGEGAYGVELDADVPYGPKKGIRYFANNADAKAYQARFGGKFVK